MDLPSILYDNHRLFQPFCFLLSLTQFYKDRLLVIWTGNRHWFHNDWSHSPDEVPTLLVADEDPVDDCCDGSIFLLNKFLNAPKREYLLQWLEQLLLLLILLLISASCIRAFVESYYIDEFNFTTPIPHFLPSLQLLLK